MFFKIGADMGIDLGTATVIVYIKGKGIVLKEPSLVVVDRNNKDKVLAVGEEARQVIERAPSSIMAVRPIKEGTISNFDFTEKMLKYFIEKACKDKKVYSRDIVICIPCEATVVEKRAIRSAAKNAGARKVFQIEKPLAAAMGAGLDILKAKGNMIVDVGAGTTDIAVIALGGLVVRKSIKAAGNKFDEEIIRFVRDNYKIAISEKTAEELKKNLGSAFKVEKEDSVEIKGRDLSTGLPKNIKVTSEDMREALRETVYLIADAVHSVLQKTPPELSADISENGIVMSGGGSLLNGLDKLIQSITNIPVYIAKDCVSCVALGTGKLLEHIKCIDENSDTDQLYIV